MSKKNSESDSASAIIRSLRTDIRKQDISTNRCPYVLKYQYVDIRVQLTYNWNS
jgi:hypothetical protein